MGRPKSDNPGVPVAFRIRQDNIDWLDAAAKELGCTRTVLIKAMLAKAKGSWTAGWRPRV